MKRIRTDILFNMSGMHIEKEYWEAELGDSEQDKQALARCNYVYRINGESYSISSYEVLRRELGAFLQQSQNK